MRLQPASPSITYLGPPNIVRENAQKIANKVQTEILNFQIKLEVTPVQHLDPLLELFAKFKVNSSQTEKITAIEQTFRRAAMAGVEADLSFLLSTGVEINSQDDNPSKRNTALHQALLNGKLNNALFLIYQGAKTNIKNANGQTAKDLINQLNESQLKDKLKALLT